MTARFPIFVNDELVGHMAITRVIEGLPPTEVANDRRIHEYRWEARQFPAGDFTGVTHGTVWHRPSEGIWKLITLAAADVQATALHPIPTPKPTTREDHP
jgi:hypothetical protein